MCCFVIGWFVLCFLCDLMVIMRLRSNLMHFGGLAGVKTNLLLCDWLASKETFFPAM